MGNKINEIGNRYGRLTVIAAAKTTNSRSMWLCKCDCGNEKLVMGKLLRNGHVTSCGCINNKVDRTGLRYTRLIVINEVPAAYGRTRWLCKCDCGNEVSVRGDGLQSGDVQSCGCLCRDINSARKGDKSPTYIHGERCGLSTNEQKDFHESIRKRDNYTCQKCGKTQDEELAAGNPRLSVHHKDGDHFNNVPDNAVTFCIKCHLAHHNRERHDKLRAERDQQDIDIMYTVAEQEQLEKDQ